MALLERLLAGDPRAVARAISLVEEDRPAAVELLKGLFDRTGQATVVGMTGAPGAGKSSLVDRLVGSWRRAERRVGVIAVDPSSAYSGGAILGDRVRMQDHAGDAGVFIRSMATRGHLGGLSRSTNDAVDLLDAAGFDPLLVETVGVGQDEVDVVKTADAVVVILVPGMGDDIQALKAGILEIADLFVINKADRQGADRLESDLRYMLSLVEAPGRPEPPILRTVAVRDEGIEELRDAIEGHVRAAGREGRLARRRERAEARLLALLADRVIGRVLREGFADGAFRRMVDEIAERRLDPYTAAQQVLGRVEIQP